ncbi:MAG: hypothetical protein ACRCWG_06460 [Sarcina sp.]
MSDISLKYSLTDENIEDYAEYLFAKKNIRFRDDIKKQKSIKNIKKSFNLIEKKQIKITKESFSLNEAEIVIPLSKVLRAEVVKSIIIIEFLNLSDGIIPKDVFESDNQRKDFILWMNKVSEENKLKEIENPTTYDDTELVLLEGIVSKDVYIRDKLKNYIIKGKMQRIRLVISTILAILLSIVGGYNQIWDFEDRSAKGEVNYINIIFVLAVIVWIIVAILQKRITGKILGSKIKTKIIKYSVTLKEEKLCIKYGDIEEVYLLEQLGGVVNKKCLITLVFKDEKNLNMALVPSTYMSEELREAVIKRLDFAMSKNGINKIVEAVLRRRNKIAVVWITIIFILVGLGMTSQGVVVPFVRGNMPHVYASIMSIRN